MLLTMYWMQMKVAKINWQSTRRYFQVSCREILKVIVKTDDKKQVTNQIHSGQSICALINKPINSVHRYKPISLYTVFIIVLFTLSVSYYVHVLTDRKTDRKTDKQSKAYDSSNTIIR